MREVIEGLLEIAEMAMPDTFFQTDSRIIAAQRLLETPSVKENSVSKIRGHNPRRYPSPVGSFVVCAVLVERVDGWCVYAAILPDHGNGWYDLDWVAKHGNKVQYSEADSHFPINPGRETYVW